MRYRNCPVCGGSKSHVLKKIEMSIPKDYHLPDSYDVVACENCGLVYADTAATMENYDWYYTRCNFYGDDSKDDNSGRFEMMKELLEKYTEKDAALLELGAGNGRFDVALKEHGYLHVTGTDPSEESVKRLRNAGITSYVASIYSEVLPEEKNKYDCIFLFEVAEHLLFPGKGIDNVVKMLKEDGVFIVSVPDYSLIGDSAIGIPNFFNLEHINYFSEVSMDFLMALHGLKRIDQKRCGADLIQLYRKEGKAETLGKDTVTEMAVRGYFSRQKNRGAYIEEMIESLRKEEKDLVIWGTGSYVMNLFATTSLPQCNIIGFVDNNKLKQGRDMYGYKIYSPDYLKDKECTVLICSMLNGEQIKKQLEEMHTKNMIVVL